MQAAGGVGDDHVDAGSLARFTASKITDAGIGALLALHDLAPDALGPDLELLGGGGAEGVAGGEHDLLALAPSACAASLPMVVVLPAPLTPTMKTTVGFWEMSQFAPADPEDSTASARSASQTACELESSFLLSPSRRPTEDGLRGGDADVGREQDLFDLIGDLRIELFLAREKARESPEESCFCRAPWRDPCAAPRDRAAVREAPTWRASPLARGGRLRAAAVAGSSCWQLLRLLLPRPCRAGPIWRRAWSTRASFGSPGLRRRPTSST